MLSVGTNIKSVSEPLRKIPLEYLYNALRHPKQEMSLKIDRLKIVRQMNLEQYAHLKQQLPYFVCATFNPPFRKTENFAYTEYFVIDIDHIGEKGLSLIDLKSKIVKDSRTVLCFQSPSQDGLKVIMKLKEKCYDPGIYPVFYKKFLYDFSVRYQVQQVIDIKTSDVARACFMSIDPDAYYNPDADTVDMKMYIPVDDSSELLNARKDIEKSFAEMSSENANENNSSKKLADPTDESISKIRELLDMKPKRKTVEKNVYVPEELNGIMEELVEGIKEIGLEVYEAINIQYGKKIRARLGTKKSEINLFYGHRGFSVVLSPKTGTDAELNQLLADVVKSYLEI